MASKCQFSPQDRIVVVLGPSGTGKSTFIDYAIKGNGEGIGPGLKSPYTREFGANSYPHPTDNHPVVLVDTPGFDEESTPATIVLNDLVEWLKTKYNNQHVDVALVVYLHKINANRMSGSLVKGLQSIKDTQTAIPDLVIATTMWSELKNKQIGERREKELKEDFWDELTNNGCRIERFEDTYDSAWKIIGNLAVKAQEPSRKGKKFTEKFAEKFASFFSRYP